MTESNGSGQDLDLAAFVASIEARRAALVDEIRKLSDVRLSVNDQIKGKRQELGQVERMWRSTQPRKSSSS